MKIDKWDFPEDLLYDTFYQWIRQDGGKVRFGLTPYGLDVTGDVLYLALPSAGDELGAGDACGSLEAGKWVGRVYAPLSGRVIRVNQAVVSNPGLISQNPYECWFVEMEPSKPEELAGLMHTAVLAVWIAEELKQDA